MRVQDEHIGRQLHVCSANPGINELPTPTPGKEPFCLGVGPAAIPGSIYANGCVLVGNPAAFPAIAEAQVMIAPANAAINPKAAVTPSLLKVTNRLTRPPTPLDVFLGDPAGMVGVTINSSVMTITEAVSINIATPAINITGVKNHAGANNKVGAENQTGTSAETGFKARAGGSTDSGVRKTTGPLACTIVKGSIFTGRALKNKGFDIEHPTRKGKRVRHICVEGPESAIYIRGKLDGTHIIDIPEYWQGLVDYDTITVNLTPFGKPDLSLYVKEIRKDKIILSSDHLTQVQCFYNVWANRIGPELHVEYDGESPADYPGDQSGHSIAGYTYDKEDA